VAVERRIDPTLKTDGHLLARLRVSHGLTELRATELALTSEEAGELVDLVGLHLTTHEIEVLHHSIEGWPAALRLAAIWLRTVEDPNQAVREFSGDQRHVAEYLSYEVLGSLDRDVRSFLLQASVLGRFTAQLCDAVLERDDPKAMLNEPASSSSSPTSSTCQRSRPSGALPPWCSS
jgi:LuxR family maltose regulon positive regulatory protein